MNNVVAFPQKARIGSRRAENGATLFLHVKQTALIVYLAKPTTAEEAIGGQAS